MSNVHSFEFEELPLAIVNGIPAGLVNGMAEITYNGSGDWEIYSISLEGYQKLTAEERARGAKPWIYVEAPHAIADLIYDRLNEREWFDRINEAVQETLASDREDAAEQRADARRDARMGL